MATARLLRNPSSQERTLRLFNNKEPVVSTVDIGCENTESGSIRLHEPEKTYTNLDCVSGTVSYSTARNDTEHVLTVALQGISRTSNTQWGQAGYETISAEWLFLCPSMRLPISSQTQESTFSLCIPSVLQPYQCPMGDTCHLELPPSLVSKKNPLSRTGIDWSIVYVVYLSIRSRSTGALLEECSQTFNFVPQPILSLSKSVVERNPLSIRLQNVLGQKLGMMSLMLPKHRVIQASPTQKPFTTPVDISLAYKGRTPPQIAQIGVFLMERTYRRTTHHHIKAGTESSYLKAHDLPVIKIGKDNCKWTQSNTELRVWHLDITLPVVLQAKADSSFLPSFESCLLSKRYEMCLILSLTSGSSMPLRPLEFSFPMTLESVLPAPRAPNDNLDAIPTYENATASAAHIAPIASVPEYRDALPASELSRIPSWASKILADNAACNVFEA